MAARQSRGDSTRPRTRRTTLTIEQLEQRAAEIRATEEHALTVLVDCMREIATRCPPEGRLGLRLATSAKTIELWARGDGQDVGVSIGMDKLCDALVHDWPDRMEDESVGEGR